MFGYIGMTFLVAISLTSELQGLKVPGLSKVLEIAERADVIKTMEAVFDNYEYLEDCHDRLNWSINITACEQLAGNLVTLKNFLFTAVEDALVIAEEAETLKTEFTNCSTESILKQIKCYTSVINSVKALVKEAKADEEEFTEDGEAIVQQIDISFANCFDKGLSSQIFETELRQCKLYSKLNSK